MRAVLSHERREILRRSASTEGFVAAALPSGGRFCLLCGLRAFSAISVFRFSRFYSWSMKRKYEEDHSALGIERCGRAVMMILKISRSLTSSSRNAPPVADVCGSISASVAQRIVDDFARRCDRRDEIDRVRNCITESNLVEVPRDARGHRDGALETLGMFGGSQIAEIAARQPDERIEHEHHAALVLAREFAHRHAAELAPSPSNRRSARYRSADTRAANGVRARARENGWPSRRSAAAELRRTDRSARRADTRRSRSRNPPRAFSRRSRKGSACECQTHPAGTLRGAESAARLSAAKRSCAECRERKPGASGFRPASCCVSFVPPRAAKTTATPAFHCAARFRRASAARQRCARACRISARCR